MNKQITIVQPRAVELPEIGDQFIFFDGEVGRTYTVVGIDTEPEPRPTLIHLKIKRKNRKEEFRIDVEHYPGMIASGTLQPKPKKNKKQAE